MATTSTDDPNASEILIRAIFDHVARIGAEQNIDELVRLNADFARDIAGADRCSLWLIDTATNEISTKISHGVEYIRIPQGEGLVGVCIAEDKVLMLNDVRQEPRLLRQIDSHSGYKTEQVLCVPMRADNKIIGALQLLNKPSGFTDTDAGLLGLLAQFAASAIQNERLRQEAESAKLVRMEITLAQAVQGRLLPTNPQYITGLRCIGFCRPAHFIGGDYYDFLQLSDGRFAFTLGDVSGKGIPAAVMMASIQTLLRSLLTRNNESLNEVVSELNRTLYKSSTEERYSTLFCGLISADRSTLTYVNAGHVTPWLLHHDGRIEILSGSGFPVGLLPETSYDQIDLKLQPRDMLVVVSDGVAEACNAEDEFWEDGEVERVLADHSNFNFDEIPKLLCDAVDTFAAGAQQYDDMTIVAVRIGN